jgi:hypothetical protein
VGNPAYHKPQTLPTGPKLGRMDDIASFKPGVWNGRQFDAAFVKQLNDNFQKLCTGPKPWYRPYVNINHKDNAAVQTGSAGRTGRSWTARFSSACPFSDRTFPG